MSNNKIKKEDVTSKKKQQHPNQNKINAKIKEQKRIIIDLEEKLKKNTEELQESERQLQFFEGIKKTHDEIMAKLQDHENDLT